MKKLDIPTPSLDALEMILRRSMSEDRTELRRLNMLGTVYSERNYSPSLAEIKKVEDRIEVADELLFQVLVNPPL